MAKVLILDDEHDICALLGEFLEDEGYEVHSATDGRVGLELVSDFKPDIIVTDIFMPGLDGIEGILHLRKTNPEVKVIAISRGDASGRRQFLHEASVFGAVATIEKPFSLLQFGELIGAVNAERAKS